jgi:hypothetical protein
MNIMEGVLARAALKMSRTLAAPTPTNIYTNSLPLAEKKGTPAYPEQALASIVFPVPGGPDNNAPFGILAPSFRYLSGFLRKSTNSITYILASASPATSLNLASRLTCAVKDLEVKPS